MNYAPKYVPNKAPTTAAILAKMNSYPTQEAQAPNRKGNISKMMPDANSGRMATVGATNASSNKIRVTQPKGTQGAPKSSGVPVPKPQSDGCSANAKTNAGPEKVSRPKADYKATNLSFIKNNPWKVGG
jgi:hypothetical protein